MKTFQKLVTPPFKKCCKFFRPRHLFGDKMRFVVLGGGARDDGEGIGLPPLIHYLLFDTRRFTRGPTAA